MTTGQDESPPISHRVVEAVADETETDPIELEPLYHSIDPDSLDRLFTGISPDAARPCGRFSFDYAGHRVHVDRDGSVEVIAVDGNTRDVRAPS